MPNKTCATCQFNDNGYCQKFDGIQLKFKNGEFIACVEYMKKNLTDKKIDKIAIKRAKEIFKEPKVIQWKKELGDQFPYEDVKPSWEENYYNLFGEKHYQVCEGKKCNCHKEVIRLLRQTIKEEIAEAFKDVGNELVWNSKTGLLEIDERDFNIIKEKFL